MEYTNSLIDEKSPYLLQHAHNPVNWYPWCDEVFNKAEREDKPIFLSIGYSTCHWCHVMEGESFEDEEVADLLNRNFVAIKVDKEERPDIDSIYMTTCQALTGQGGWPLTIIMTPDQKPFFAGTYFPKRARYRMPGLMDILTTISETWEKDKRELIQTGEQISNALIEQIEDQGMQGDLSKELIETAFSLYQRSFDEKYGGFGHAPKFPTPHNLMFLMRYYAESKNKDALEMVEKTLLQMYRGGIFDHIGFGFSRYSTDETWLIPHFEKMLYDNALLTITYLEAFQITKNELYRNIAERTMSYILREMTDSKGGFYSAQDADSEREEGKYYAFTPDEIIDILGEGEGNYLISFFHITEQGNFEGKSIPNLLLNDNFDKRDQEIEQMCKKVSDYRERRTILHKDDKILTSWNALMIVAFAKAYRILGDEKYLQAANNAVTFIENNLINPNGHLFVRYREEDAAGVGTLDDYAFLVWALIELYESTFEISYLKKALDWNEKMMQNFWDDVKSGFYMTSQMSESLLYRPKELYDGAIPSGNSVAAYNLMRLARLTGDAQIEERAYQQLRFMAGAIENYPVGYSFFLQALQLGLSSSREIVCVINNKNELQAIKDMIRNKFMPNTVFFVKDMEKEDEINEVIPSLKDYLLKENKATYYLCEDHTCKPSFTSIEQLMESMKSQNLVLQK